MIELDFYRETGYRYYAFEMTGHAEYAEYGSDIVCSAMTALGAACIGSMTDLLELDVDYVLAPGLITLEVPDVGEREAEMEEKIDLLFRAFELGARQIQASIDDDGVKGSDFVRIRTLEMSEEDYDVEV